MKYSCDCCKEALENEACSVALKPNARLNKALNNLVDIITRREEE